MTTILLLVKLSDRNHYICRRHSKNCTNSEIFSLLCFRLMVLLLFFCCCCCCIEWLANFNGFFIIHKPHSTLSHNKSIPNCLFSMTFCTLHTPLFRVLQIPKCTPEHGMFFFLLNSFWHQIKLKRWSKWPNKENNFRSIRWKSSCK